MRFVLAIVSCVLGIVLMGLGIAQRTVWAGPASIDAVGTTTGDAPVTVIDGSVFNAYAGNPTLIAQNDGLIFAAYGRTTDVLGWVGDATYNSVSINAKGELTSKVVQGDEAEVPDPTGSDLWLQEFAGERTLRAAVGIPENVSVILTSDGVAPPPADLQVSWPLDNSTPWATPLMIGGGVVLLIGVGFLLWAINGMRRSRGPRRKSPKPPKELRKRYKPGTRKPIDRGTTTDAPSQELARPTTGRRSAARGFIAIPAVLVGALVLAGCTAGPVPQLTAAPDPTASSAQDTLEIPPPAVTERQVNRIVDDIIAVAAEADTSMDTTLLESRFAGPALLQRQTDYKVRTNDPSLAANVPAIPDADVLVTLPQQTDTWPRVVMVVVGDESDDTIAPVALMLQQETPRDPYKVYYAITLEPAATLPNVAPANVGAARLGGETGILKIEPDSLALAYGDVLQKDVESGNYLDFESDGDSLRVSIRDAKSSEAANLAATATISFTQALGEGDAVALATNDAGAIVAVELSDITTVTPVEAGAAVNPSGRVKALTGLSISTKGIAATYQVQLLFAVPPVGSDDKIVLLGYSYGLVAATEVG